MAKRMKRMPPEMEMTHGWSVCGTNKRVFHDEDLNGEENEENAAGDGDDAGRQHAREVVPAQNSAERRYDVPCSRAENHYRIRERAEGSRTGGDGMGSGESDRGELRPVAPLGEEDHDERLEDDLRMRGV